MINAASQNHLKPAGHGRVALHLYASLVRRFEVYDGKFLRKPFEPDETTKKADTVLRNRFLIKQRVTGLKKNEGNVAICADYLGYFLACREIFIR